MNRWIRAAIVVAGLVLSTAVPAQLATPRADGAIAAQAGSNEGPLLATLKELVEIESGSDDREGLDRISQLTLDRLKGLGGNVEFIGFGEYGTLSVLINGDEEVSSPGARSTLTRLGASHDVTMSFEASRIRNDKLSLATSGIGGVIIKVKGKASHAGTAPERGINALTELAHQILQTKDLSDRKAGLKMNWTNAKAGSGLHNVIPESAEAFADVRVNRLDDYDRIEREVRSRVANQVVPNAKVEFVFERRRPPLQPSPAAQVVANHPRTIMRNGREILVDTEPEGGGTDAAFAALQTKNAVVERFGVQGYGAHSAEDEYILISSIEPRLYLVTRLIMDISRDRVH